MTKLASWLKQFWKAEGQESLATPEDIYQEFILFYREHHSDSRFEKKVI